MSSTTERKPIVWTIAGSDPSGGAGVQADLQTLHALEAHGCSVVSVLTAQNSTGVERFMAVPLDMLDAQIQSLAKDIPPRVVKVGMLASSGHVRSVAKFLAAADAPAVCDPIISTGTGKPVMDPPTLEAFLNRLLPAASLVTPNAREAAQLAALPPLTPDSMEEAARRILDRGPSSVLIKGGHINGETSLDYWSDGEHRIWMESPRLGIDRVHGAGCVLSSAVAARLAHKNDLGDALVIAKAYVNQGLRHPVFTGKGAPSLGHLGFPDTAADLPLVAHRREDLHAGLTFARLPQVQPRVYPIVETFAKAEELLAAGVKILQLRIKRKLDWEVEKEIRDVIDAGRRHNALVIINDHWQQALRHGAKGLHIGQDDLDSVDLRAISASGMVLGISTHSAYELARAVTLNPSYVAIGTVFPTTSKSGPVPLLGLDGFARLARLSRLPVVAIGGLNPERGKQAITAGATLCAVISDLGQAADPGARVNEWRAVTG
jgi:hydroxymethylpyrimidine kinase / phosphomethylpyrimidine kinase / thiamine-phosphate diphosphorylase